MGTIGDQFGDLAALFGGEGEASPKTQPAAPSQRVDGSIDANSESQVSKDQGVSGEGESFQSVLIATICDLNGQSAEDFDLDAHLAEDLDIQGLPLWALAAELERHLGTTFPDPVVRAWKTPRDVLSAGLTG